MSKQDLLQTRLFNTWFMTDLICDIYRGFRNYEQNEKFHQASLHDTIKAKIQQLQKPVSSRIGSKACISHENYQFLSFT